MAYEMNTNNPDYLITMIEEVTKYRPARLDSAAAVAVATLWGQRMVALSNLAIAHELARLRETKALEE